jgi:hypothetical protein
MKSDRSNAAGLFLWSFTFSSYSKSQAAFQTRPAGDARRHLTFLSCHRKVSKRRHPTLSRLLTQVPGAEASSAGRAKTR